MENITGLLEICFCLGRYIQGHKFPVECGARTNMGGLVSRDQELSTNTTSLPKRVPHTPWSL